MERYGVAMCGLVGYGSVLSGVVWFGKVRKKCQEHFLQVRI